MVVSLAQNDIAFQYNAPAAYPIPRVAEDFGQRTLSGRCWHTGIDINTGGANADMGDAIYPLDTGTVLFTKWVDDYKVICIESNDGTIYAYGHLFYDGTVPQEGMRCGNFLLKEVESDSTDHAIIYFNEQGVPIKAYCRLGNDSVVVKNNFGNDTTLYTTNKVSRNLPVAPMGISDADYTHLHFYRFNVRPQDQADFHRRVMGGTTGFGYTAFSTNSTQPPSFPTTTWTITSLSVTTSPNSKKLAQSDPLSLPKWVFPIINGRAHKSDMSDWELPMRSDFLLKMIMQIALFRK